MLSLKNNELDSTHSQMEKLKDIIGTDTALIPFVNLLSHFFFLGSISPKWVLPDSLSQQVYQHKQEAEVLRISFSALKIRKNVLEEEVATKTKRLAVLQEQLGKKVASILLLLKPFRHVDALIAHDFLQEKNLNQKRIALLM